jgi:hypothetical protein
MDDGESRLMQPGPYLGAERNKVKITAVRVDADTPIVTLEFEGVELHMTDVLAEDVVKRISKALRLLPTSK